MDNYMDKINEKSPFYDLTIGGVIYGGSNSTEFNTGVWRTQTPIFHIEKCVQCLLCFPVCPDNAIPVENGKRKEFNLNYCKGCGICVMVCPCHAITFDAEEEKYEP